jgi:hypothetical protein
VDFGGGDEQGERRTDRGKSSPVGSGRREGEHRGGMGRIDASAGEHPPAAGVLYERYRLCEVPGAEGASCEQRPTVGVAVAPGEGAEDRSRRDQQCGSIRGTCELGSVD